MSLHGAALMFSIRPPNGRHRNRAAVRLEAGSHYSACRPEMRHVKPGATPGGGRCRAQALKRQQENTGRSRIIPRTAGMNNSRPVQSRPVPRGVVRPRGRRSLSCLVRRRLSDG
ncbi:MAG: hypothetical protein DWQ34_20215 [Planctomycetota bacterium]|nr:MAG: hypothetical protein DWQ34_20215 [Planctomycetota bacterium]